MSLTTTHRPTRSGTRALRASLPKLRGVPVPSRQIQDYCDAIVREFKPERIVLFGSYAGGQPTPHSDVDLFIILKGGKYSRDLNRALAIRRKITAPFAVDLIVRKPEFVAGRLAEGDMFITGIMQDGKVMYESKHA
ncbi:MAG: nucleotidyltransferase domain-containing protein [Actinomycetota bacterium]